MKFLKNIVFFLIIYLPLEEFILKWFFVSVRVYEILLFFSDFLIILSILIFLIQNNFVLKFNRRTKYFSLFILFSIISLIYSQALIPYFLKIWVLTRYVFLYFIITRIFDLNDYKRVERLIIITFFFQLIVGLVQLFNVPLLYDFFSPRSDLSMSSNWLVKGESGIAGTFNFTVIYGYFMFVFCGFVVITEYSKKKKVLLILLAVILSLYSESSISFLVSILFFLRYTFLLYPKFFFRYITLLALLTTPFYYESIINLSKPLMLVFNIFSEQSLIESINFTRLGIIKLFPLFFSNDLFTVLFGFSLDGDALTLFIENKMGSDIPHVLLNNAVIGIEDVYWVAHLYYFGLFGILFFVLFFKNLFKGLKIDKSLPKELIVQLKMMKLLIILTLLLGFVNQVFSFKTFMLYFLITISYIYCKKRINPKHSLY